MKTEKNNKEANAQFEPVPELLEASGSLEQYQKDVQAFVDRALKEIDRMKKTKSGRARLEKAFGKKES